MAKIIVTEGSRPKLWFWEVQQDGYDDTVGIARTKEKAEEAARKRLQARYDRAKKEAEALVIEIPDFEAGK